MALNDLEDLYRGAILDHCRHPRNHDTLETPDASGQAVNPFCGDEVDLQITVDGARVSRVGVQGRGCSINQASSSMLSEAVAGKTLEDVQGIADLFRSMMGGAPTTDQDLERLGDLQTLSGVQEFPVRIKCALLAWSALEEAIEDFQKAPRR